MGDLDFTKEARDIIWRRAKETVPRVESSVPIWRYTDTARRWYGQIYTHQSKPRAKNADQVVADLQLAYFYVVNFLELTINGIFKHNAFNSAGNKKDAIWCKQRVDVCMKNMEEIIKAWNLTEEARIQREVMRELDGGADDDDDFVTVALGTGSSAGASAIADSASAGGMPFPSAPPLALLPTDADLAPSAGDYVDALRDSEALEQLRNPGSDDNLALLKCLKDPLNFQPTTLNPPRPYKLVFGSSSFVWNHWDYGVTFLPWLPSDLPAALQISTAACETNRCLFLHLGVAFKIHPFALQFAFRARAYEGLKGLAQDDFSKDVVSSVLEHASFVDANALAFLWPKEFNNSRVCIMSGPPERPLFTVFKPMDVPDGSLWDVLIRCDGQHFTLLQTQQGELTKLLQLSKRTGLVVMETEVECKPFGAAEEEFSIAQYISKYT